MIPWYDEFTGTIKRLDKQLFMIYGEAAILDEETFEITELPIGVSTQSYKKTILEPMLKNNPPYIKNFKEYHTNASVKFVITMYKENLQQSLNNGIHKTFKIQRSMSTTTMMLFDYNGNLKKDIKTAEEILTEYYPIRLKYYKKRIEYYNEFFKVELKKLNNQLRFISDNDNIPNINKTCKKDLIAILVKRN